jgi:predicted transcriptional regulator
MDILNILWDHGPLTVRQVHDELEQTKPSGYTSTLKIMQILVEKSLLERDTVEGAHCLYALGSNERRHSVKWQSI